MRSGDFFAHRRGLKLSLLRALLPRPALVGRIGRRWRHGLAVVTVLALIIGGAATLAAMPASAGGGSCSAVSNASFNGNLNPRANTQLSAQFTNSGGTNVAPTVSCTGGGTKSSVAPTVSCTGGGTSGGHQIMPNPPDMSVGQGTTGSVAFTLSTAPTSNETVSIAASGNTGLTASPTSLTFTPTNFSTPQTVTVTANATGTGVTTFTASGTGYTPATVTATEVPANDNTPTPMVSPASQGITQSCQEPFQVWLSSAPSANVTVSVARTSGNTGLSVSAGSSLTFTPQNFATAQSVTITADNSSSGAATFTVSAAGLTPATFTATEAAPCTGSCTAHVADPFTGATPYLNPDYVKEVQTAATADGSAAEASVATWQTAIWLDTMASINGGTTATGTRTGLMQQLTNAAAQGTAAKPALVEIVIYDLPGRDCAALASNGEIPGTAAGLTTYEQNYITPIASILQQFETAPIRVVAIIEPDSLPNAVTNQNLPACATATPLYEQGITFALNALHAIPNVYNYLDIADSAWLGWPSSMNGTPAVYNSVVQATTAGYASIDGFISDTANYIPTQEPFLTNPTLNVGGNPLDSVLFYQFNPTFDELSYDTAMYSTLMAAGFPASKKFLIDTSRNGWGGPLRPTALNSSPATAAAYVAANKIDQRPFRGDWCNQNNAGIGARPADQPFGASSPILAFVWIKPPGESDGDYPTATHSHGEPDCDPNGTNTDANGNTYSTGSIPGFDVPADQFFNAEFQMLVKNAFPAL